MVRGTGWLAFKVVTFPDGLPTDRQPATPTWVGRGGAAGRVTPAPTVGGHPRPARGARTVLCRHRDRTEIRYVPVRQYGPPPGYRRPPGYRQPPTGYARRPDIRRRVPAAEAALAVGDAAAVRPARAAAAAPTRGPAPTGWIPGLGPGGCHVRGSRVRPTTPTRRKRRRRSEGDGPRTTSTSPVHRDLHRCLQQDSCGPRRRRDPLRHPPGPGPGRRASASSGRRCRSATCATSIRAVRRRAALRGGPLADGRRPSAAGPTTATRPGRLPGKSTRNRRDPDQNIVAPLSAATRLLRTRAGASVAQGRCRRGRCAAIWSGRFGAYRPTSPAR